MSQGLNLGWIKAVGIVPVLFGMGIVLRWFNIMNWLGAITIIISISIGVIYGLLGAVNISKNMEIIEIKKTTVSLDMIFNIFRRKK